MSYAFYKREFSSMSMGALKPATNVRVKTSH
jgi:hypothetical protein